MAASELELKLTWENGVNFTLTSKHDASAVKTIVSMDENGNLAALWLNVQNICETYVRQELETIGRVMKQG